MFLTLSSIIAALAGLGFAAWLAMKIKKQAVQNKRVQVISDFIREGAMTFLIKEYKILAVFVVIVAIIIAVIPALSWKIAIAFVIGAVFSLLAGLVGMKVATIANVRAAEKCQEDSRAGFLVAFSSGSVTGLSVVGLGLLGIGLLYLIFNNPTIIFGFGFGASSVALFARVGGGIYTKSADIGADLAGKLEKNIAEDDPRNPATIADNVGDNVGDVAGMGADLFESYVDSIIVAMVLGMAFLPIFGSAAVGLPMVLAGIGIVASIIGIFLMKYLKGDFQRVLNNSVWLASLIMVVGSFLAIKFIIGDLKFFYALFVGLAAGMLIGRSIQYSLSDRNRPAQEIAEAAETGSATNIISGLSFGFLSAIAPVFFVALALYFSYRLSDFYGVAIAAVGMLSTLGITLAANSYGPVMDNAAGIAKMAGMSDEAKKRAEELDTSGNTAAAVGKGFAIGSAVLTALVLLVAFGEAVNLKVINLLSVNTLIGLLIGGLLPFVFSALAMKAVSQTAEKMVAEVRRQFKEITGLLSGEAEPDYKSCISISTNSALKQMLAPGLLAILAPILVGLFLGPESLAGLVAGAILVGFLLAVFMISSGGVWDNAKKFIEAGNLGGRGGVAHKAAIVGDTIGDPLKDTAGPALNILIKLMAIISIIIAPLLIR